MTADSDPSSPAGAWTQAAGSPYATSAATGVSDYRVLGLDSLRFVAAMWVVLSHVGLPRIFDELGQSSFAGLLLRGALGVLFSGPAAVIVFFVISGFCIHFPYVSRSQFRIGPYLIRRYVRICVPMAAATLITSASGIDAIVFFGAVLWSLVAEMMYYTIYPLIRKLLTHFSINSILAASFCISVLIVATTSTSNGYAVYGWKLNWLVGLPCWLLGVKLAMDWAGAQFASSHAAIDGAGRIWKWRITAWALSSVCSAMNFHSSIGYSWTLGVFALFASTWLWRELIRANTRRRPWPILEWGGKWSYSVYLVHMSASAIYSQAGTLHPYPIGDWIAKVAFVLVASYVFFRLFELPAHRLARWASKIP